MLCLAEELEMKSAMLDQLELSTRAPTLCALLHFLRQSALARTAAPQRQRLWRLSKQSLRDGLVEVQAWSLTFQRKAVLAVIGRKPGHHEQEATKIGASADQDEGSSTRSDLAWNVEETRTSDFDRDVT